MPSPLKLSLDNIRREAREEVAFLEDTIVKFPSWSWPRDLLPLSREFEKLVFGDAINPERAHDLTERLRAHIRQERLKGFDATIWRAEALEDLIRKAPHA